MYAIDPEKNRKECEKLARQINANYEKYNDNGYIEASKLFEGTILDSKRRFDGAFDFVLGGSDEKKEVKSSY